MLFRTALRRWLLIATAHWVDWELVIVCIPTQLRIWLFTQLLMRETKQEWEAKSRADLGLKGKPLLLCEESRARDN